MPQPGRDLTQPSRLGCVKFGIGKIKMRQFHRRLGAGDIGVAGVHLGAGAFDVLDLDLQLRLGLLNSGGGLLAGELRLFAGRVA